MTWEEGCKSTITCSCIIGRNITSLLNLLEKSRDQSHPIFGRYKSFAMSWEIKHGCPFSKQTSNLALIMYLASPARSTTLYLFSTKSSCSSIHSKHKLKVIINIIFGSFFKSFEYIKSHFLWIVNFCRHIHWIAVVLIFIQDSV